MLNHRRSSPMNIQSLGTSSGKKMIYCSFSPFLVLSRFWINKQRVTMKRYFLNVYFISAGGCVLQSFNGPAFMTSSSFFFQCPCASVGLDFLVLVVSSPFIVEGKNATPCCSFFSILEKRIKK